MFRGLKDRIANDTRRGSPANNLESSPAVKKKINQSGNSVPLSPAEAILNATPTKTSPPENGGNVTPSDSESETPEHTGQPSGFFKRLEFLSPLRDQFAAKLTGSQDSVNSEIAEVKYLDGTNTPEKNQGQNTPTVSNDNNSHEDKKSTPVSSMHDGGGGDNPAVSIDDVSKEQLLDKILRIEKTLHKYRERYSELMERLKSTMKDNEKIKSVMQQLQERHSRRIQEMNEAAELDRQAKMHLEEELNASIEEKLEMIEVLQTQVKLLKSGEDPSGKKKDGNVQLVPVEDVEQLKAEVENHKQNVLALQQQLEAKSQDIDNVKKVHLEEKSKLIRQLKKAKSLVEQLEQDKGMAMAEAKRLTHEAMEVKDAELQQIHHQPRAATEEMSQVKESKAKKENAMFEELEAALANVQRLEEEKTSILQEHEITKRHIQKIHEDHSVEMKKLKANSEKDAESLSNELKASREEILSKTRQFEKEKSSLQNNLKQVCLEVENLRKRLSTLNDENQRAKAKYEENIQRWEKSSDNLQKSLDTERNKSQELQTLLQENELKFTKKTDDLTASLESELSAKNNNLRAELQKAFALEKESLVSQLQQQFNTEKLQLQQAALSAEDNKGSEKEAELLSRLQEMQKLVSSKTEDLHQLKATVLEQESVVREIRNENDRLSTEAKIKVKDIEIAQENAIKTRNELAQSRLEQEKVTDELNGVKSEFRSKEIDLETITKDLAGKNELLTLTNLDKENLTKTLEATKTELNQIRALMHQKESEIVELKESIGKGNTKLVELTESLEAKRKENEESVSSHQEELANLKESWNVRSANLKKKREATVAGLQKEFEEEKAKLKMEYKKRQKDLEERLSSQSSKEKNEFEAEVASRLTSKHSDEIASIQGQWKSKYGELKQKAEQRIVQLQEKTKELQVQLEASRSQLSSIQAEAKNAIKKIESEKLIVEQENEKLQERSSHVEKLSNQLQSAKLSLQELTSQRNDVNALYQSEVAMVEKLKEELQVSKNNLLQSEAALAEVQKQFSEKSEALESLRKKTEPVKKKIIELQKLVKTKSSECSATEENLHEALQQVERSNAEAKKKSEEINTLSAVLKESKTTMQSLEKSTTQLKSDLLAASTERDEAVREHEKAVALGHLLTEETTTLKSEIESLNAQSASKEAEAKMRMEEAIDELKKESQAKVNELKKKAEQRLTQIKKTFGSQLEDKLGKISELTDANALLEQEVASLKEEDKLNNEIVNKEINEKHKFEREQMEGRIAELEKIINENSDKTKAEVAVICEDEKRRLEEGFLKEKEQNNEEKLKLNEIKNRLEIELSESRVKLEEAKVRMQEENDHFEIALKEERERKALAESNLAKALLKQNDVSQMEEAWNAAEKDRADQISQLQAELASMQTEFENEKENLFSEKEQLFKEAEVSKKRIEKLEKNREVLKSQIKQQLAVDGEEKQTLQSEVSSLRKQLEVLNQSSSENASVETELMLEELKKDFQRRIEEKEKEHEEKVKRLIKEYETEHMKMEERHQEQLDKTSDRNASSDRQVREQHHEEVVALQKEILKYEQDMETLIEQHEMELQSRETEMSEQVDKATFRALTAEKRLQEAGFEDAVKKLQFQVNELSKELSQSQQRQRETATQLDSATTKLSCSSPLADPERLKYLRQVLYQYMMGAEGKTMAKVLVVLLQYPPEEAQKILERHGK